MTAKPIFTIACLVLAFCATGAECLTGLRIADVAKMSRRKAYHKTAFAVSGQIVVRNGNTLHVRDSSGCICLIAESCGGDLKAGDVVSVTGVFEQTDRLRLLSVDKVERHPTPPPRTIRPDQLRDRSLRHDFVQLSGVVFSISRDEMDSRANWLILKSGDSLVMANVSASDWPLDRLAALVDAEIRLQGTVERNVTWREELGERISPCGPNPFSIVRPAPADIDDIPPYSQANAQHRQRMQGVVAAVGKNRFFIRQGKYACRQVRPAHHATIPAVGDHVTVAGFADLDPLHVQLVEAIVRKDPPQAAERTQPEVLEFEKAFSQDDDEARMLYAFDRKLVRLSGTLRHISVDRDKNRSLVLECSGRTVSVDVSGLSEQPDPSFVPGCILSIVGLFVTDFEVIAPSVPFPRLKGLTVIPRTADDIVVVRHPPWWTVGRLLVLVILLVVALVAISIWNRTLKIHSERRGRELYKEELARALAEWKVEERTRLSVELHDSISQTLTGVALQVDAAKGAGLDAKSPAARFLETARALLASCRQELRCCIWDLRSRTFEEKDLTEAVRRTLAPHAGDTDIQVRFNVPREILSETTTHDILRIVRELVINAIRHGRAQHIKVAGEFRDGQVRFSVRDDGCGFDPSSAPGAREGHFGLQGIRERIGGRNGDVRIDSAAGCGTKIIVSFAAEGREENEP